MATWYLESNGRFETFCCGFEIYERFQLDVSESCWLVPGTFAE
jgi:hypothetical protein